MAQNFTVNYISPLKEYPKKAFLDFYWTRSGFTRLNVCLWGEPGLKTFSGKSKLACLKKAFPQYLIESEHDVYHRLEIDGYFIISLNCLIMR